MHLVLLAISPRYIAWTLSAVALLVFLALSILHWVFLIGVAAAAFLTWLGYHDVTDPALDPAQLSGFRAPALPPRKRPRRDPPVFP